MIFMFKKRKNYDGISEFQKKGIIAIHVFFIKKWQNFK